LPSIASVSGIASTALTFARVSQRSANDSDRLHGATSNGAATARGKGSYRTILIGEKGNDGARTRAIDRLSAQRFCPDASAGLQRAAASGAHGESIETGSKFRTPGAD
jgi:hypothetical protein